MTSSRSRIRQEVRGVRDLNRIQLDSSGDTLTQQLTTHDAIEAQADAAFLSMKFYPAGADRPPVAPPQ
jgi:hypothetical protein